MSVLLLRLAGPMQAWGDSSRFSRRNTRREPTKSGVIGLLAAAQGRQRDDDIADLVKLEYGVRVEQPGRIIRDFQTEQRADTNTVMPLTNRYYLCDAVFLVALSAPTELLHSLDQALQSPRWPLFLGRRSCPASLPITLGIHEQYESVAQALEQEEWHADEWFRKKNKLEKLTIARDAQDGETFETQSDLPLSFNMEHRRYASRSVHHYEVSNPSLASDKQENFAPSTYQSEDGYDPMNF